MWTYKKLDTCFRCKKQGLHNRTIHEKRFNFSYIDQHERKNIKILKIYVDI